MLWYLIFIRYPVHLYILQRSNHGKFYRVIVQDVPSPGTRDGDRQKKWRALLRRHNSISPVSKGICSGLFPSHTTENLILYHELVQYVGR